MGRRRKIKRHRTRERETQQEVERYKSNFNWTMENYGARKEDRERGYIDMTPPAPPYERYMLFKERLEETYGRKIPPWEMPPIPLSGMPEDLLDANPADEDLEDAGFRGGFLGRPDGWER